jgi:hypothetical protein
LHSGQILVSSLFSAPSRYGQPIRCAITGHSSSAARTVLQATPAVPVLHQAWLPAAAPGAG